MTAPGPALTLPTLALVLKILKPSATNSTFLILVHFLNLISMVVSLSVRIACYVIPSVFLQLISNTIIIHNNASLIFLHTLDTSHWLSLLASESPIIVLSGFKLFSIKVAAGNVEEADE